MSLINQALKKAQSDRDKAKLPPVDYKSMSHAEPKQGNPAQKTDFKLIKYGVAALIAFVCLGAAISFMAVVLDKGEPQAVVQAEPTEELEVGYKNISRAELVAQQQAQMATQQTTAPAPAPVQQQQQQQQQQAPQPVQKPEPVAQVSAQPKPVVQTITPPAPVQQPATVAKPSPAAPQPTAPAPTPLPEPQPAPVVVAPVAPQATPVVAQPRPADPPPTSTVQSQLAIPSNPEDLIPQPVKQPVFTEKKSPQAAPAPKQQQPAQIEKPKANPYVVAFLEASKITGVRLAGKKSKVLMNNQVFRANSIVEPKTNLRITDIMPNEIHFVDESGFQYRKQFQ